MPDRIIVPYFLLRRRSLQTVAGYFAAVTMPQLPDGMIYQQDGAPPHFAIIVRTFIDVQFRARWMGRSSPYITWPATSRDLTPPDFCGDLLKNRSTRH